MTNQPSTPDTPAKTIAQVHQEAFVSQGMLVAFPTCFPGVTLPIPADESHITALDITRDGVVYGGTSGRRAHVFRAHFHRETGAVFDVGVAAGGDECVGVACGVSRALVFVNGARGGRVLACEHAPPPFSLIQEWGPQPQSLVELDWPYRDERIVHAVASADDGSAIVATERRLARVDVASGRVEDVAACGAGARLTVDGSGCVLGLDTDDSLWRLDPAAERLTRRAVALPDGDWSAGPVWSRGPDGAPLYAADASGRLFALRSDDLRGPLGRLPLTPVGPMAVTCDGRLFGFCGDGIARMFLYDPRVGEVVDLGAAVSVIQSRRYGFCFGDAVVGPNGEIIFGEKDDLGHLWLYFPRILAAGSGG